LPGMPYIDQFDDLLRAQDNGQRIQNVRTMAVFTDGLVICAVGVNGVWLVSDLVLPRFGGFGGMLLTLIRPGQRAVRRRRQKAIRRRALSLGPDGSAAAFARTRRKALAIPFADVTNIALTPARGGQQLIVYTLSPGTGREQAYPYLNQLPAGRVREVLGPLIGARLTIAAEHQAT
jgi:hypothetical protein